MNIRSTENDELLHQKLRRILCRQIFEGVYPDGVLLPAERELAEKYGMSRVTVRNTLAGMEKEGVVTRRQGHGTRVSLLKNGFPGKMEIITVIAPAENPFFASFISSFETCAEERDALVVFKAIGKRRMEDMLFRFYERSIRNAVIWPYDETINIDALAKLRGLGMNLVIFDRVVDGGVADCLSVNNADAIKKLYAYLRGKCGSDITYIGWDNDVISSNRERESAFAAISGDLNIHRLPWRRESDVDADVALLMKIIPRNIRGVLCGNGVIGIAVKRYVDAHSKNFQVACVDDLPGAGSLSLTAYAQPMRQLATAACRLLAGQNEKAGVWKAENIYIKGNLQRRSG